MAAIIVLALYGCVDESGERHNPVLSKQISDMPESFLHA